MTGKELGYIKDAHARGQVAGDGHYTKLCEKYLEGHLGAERVLLTHSCTAALEMTALLLDFEEGDEVIMPSYTFVSTANAFALRGVIPVFADVKPETMCIDEQMIPSLITPKTKAILPVHYAGISCDMESIMAMSQRYNLDIIEDAAQALGSKHSGKMLGSIGKLGTLSFHETKNIISGEGGALVINDSTLIEKAQIIREKGTNRCSFFRGEVDKYTWVDLGSSYLPGELISAFLYAQLIESININERRSQLWHEYYELFEILESRGDVRRPKVPANCIHNGHIFFLLVNSAEIRFKLLEYLNKRGIGSIFHYIPLHSSPAGIKYGATRLPLPNTEEYSSRLVRLPLWHDMDAADVERVFKEVRSFFTSSF